MEFRILGTLAVLDGATSVALGGRRQQLVLAGLLVHANETVTTDRLIDIVWGTSPPATARKTLQVYVSRLRQALGDESIGSNADGYRLRGAPDDIDASRFERLVEEARNRFATDPAGAAITLRAALALWQGAPWGPLGDEPALRAHRQRLEERRLEAIEARVEADLVTGNAAGLVGELEALIADHPLREPLHGRLMRTLYEAGRQADALAAFHRLRDGLDRELGIVPSPALQRLHERILRQDPGLSRSKPPGQQPEVPLDAAVGTAPRNPYKGLRAFTEDDAGDFFGREPVVTAMLERVATTRFLAVVGPSGSGKSSVVRAGVLPALRWGDRHAGQDESQDPDAWLIATMVPGSHPFEAVEAALLRACPIPPPSLRDQFRGDDLDLLRAVLRIRPEDHTRVLLVIDQFEELYLLVDDHLVQQRFARNLVEAVEDPATKLTVLVTLRADLFDRPLSDRTLGELVGQGLLSLPPLRPGQLEAACSRPAAAVGVTVEPELAAELVSDVADEPGALPLFEYALTETFAARRGGTLSLDTYRRIGGLQGALGRRSDEVFADLGAAERDAARQLFLRLVTFGDSSEATRRRVRRSELDALDLGRGVVTDVIDAFGRARLLAFDRDPVTGEGTVEVAHEALLGAWPRLRTWIDEAHQELRLHRTLTVAAAEWEAADRDPDYLLSGSRLALHDHRDDRTQGAVVLTSSERAFLEASRERRDLAVTEEAERQRHELELERRARRRLRTLVAVLASAALLGVGLTGYAVVQAREAREARDQAVAASELLRGRELSSLAVARRQTDPELSLLLALHAVDRLHAAGQQVPSETVAAVHWALQAAQLPYPPEDVEVAVLSGPAGPQGVALHPLPTLLELANGATERELTDDECRTYLGRAAPCGPPLSSVPADLAWERPTSLNPPDGPVPALSGTTVRVFSVGLTEDTLRPELERLEERTGITVHIDVEPSEDLLGSRTGPDGVDIALIPQPARVAALARSGELLPVSHYLDPDELRAMLSPELVTLGSVSVDGRWPAADGDVYAVPIRLDLKSLVWYPATAFAAAGYAVPTTLDDLVALTERLVADGHSPWCHGEASGAASGWPGTDWIERLVLHGRGPAAYDAWVAGERPFGDPEVRDAFERFDALVLDGSRLFGGRRVAATLRFDVAPQPLFEDPPGCWLFAGSSFSPDVFPHEVRIGEEVDWFPFPDAGAGRSDLVLGSGEFAVAFADRPEVREVVRALTAADWGQELARQGVWYFPGNRTIPLEAYADERARAAATLLQQALEGDGYRFDGSDLMPDEVNRAFWDGMVSFVAEGPDNLDDVLSTVDAAWPSDLPRGAVELGATEGS
jgi:DNA-binding SARP family transcriptional activator/ABC-type glycerol-3-phosphate transport system substrate-binding protein